MTALIIVGWLLGWVLLWRMPKLRAPRRDGTESRISVVIPVRNEVDRIPLLLASLERQRRRPHQVIVVDDGSDDGSASAVRAFPWVELVTASPVPPGWTGKSWACETGAHRADGDLLVFLDADVVLGADALDQLVATWSDVGGLVSVQPLHRTERPFESLSLMFNVVAVMGLAVRGGDAASRKHAPTVSNRERNALRGRVEALLSPNVERVSEAINLHVAVADGA